MYKTAIGDLNPVCLLCRTGLKDQWIQKDYKKQKKESLHFLTYSIERITQIYLFLLINFLYDG